jgi:hypothetical protein
MTELAYLDKWIKGEITEDGFMKVCNQLNDALLGFYQIFYREKLTQPGSHGGPWKLSLSFPTGGLTIGYWVEASRKFPNGDFIFTRAKTPQKLLFNAKALDHAYLIANMKKFDPRVCCALAQRQNCVCSLSWECPIHGSQCIGSHD